MQLPVHIVELLRKKAGDEDVASYLVRLLEREVDPEGGAVPRGLPVVLGGGGQAPGDGP